MAENFVNGWLYADIINDPTAFGSPPSYNNLVWNLKGFHQTVASSMLYSATNPDLRQFKKEGGKLILWAGWADQHIAPRGTIRYWVRMNQVTGNTDDFARLYMFPGMAHCGGGLGPNSFDVLKPLMKWVENDKAPYRLKVTGNDMTRPVYPYPTVAQYVGSGSVNNLKNFVPYTRKNSYLDLHNAGDYLYSPGFPQVNCVAVGDKIVCDNGRKF